MINCLSWFHNFLILFLIFGTTATKSILIIFFSIPWFSWAPSGGLGFIVLALLRGYKNCQLLAVAK